jgi:putative membrane-bound dehydrogenase-like protein
VDRLSHLLAATCLVVLSAAAPLPAANLGIRVPAGFEVTRFAGDELAHDIFSIATTADGHIAVSGPGYVKILEDGDGDGAADRAHVFAEIKSGAFGMYFDGADLIYSGENKVARLRDTDGDRVGDREETWTELAHTEHGTHHIIKGPDGWFYIAAGNDAGVSSRHASTSASPIKNPVCGAIVRFSPDGHQSEIVADGYRNMCGLDFNSYGHLFTVDSDNERDQHLPWYCPTRLFDVAIGQNHGWLQRGWQQGWNRPAVFFDAVERLVEIGRGSPTGVVVYRHRAWPEHYRDGVFSACWSMGKIYYCPLTRRAATYESKLEVFLEGEGATGLAIVGLAVDPGGDMYVAVGGRKTQGSVYRVRYIGPNTRTREEQASEAASRANLGSPLYDVLTADQPLANWSRARWETAAQEIGKTAIADAAADASLPDTLRVRAIEILVDRFGGLDTAAIGAIARTAKPAVAARAAWAAGHNRRDPAALDLLLHLTAAQDAAVRRAAWEAMIDLDLAQDEWHRMANKLSDAMQRDTETLMSDPALRRVVAAQSVVLRRLATAANMPPPNSSEAAHASDHAPNPARDSRWQQLATDIVRKLQDNSSALNDYARLIVTRHLQIAAGDIPHWTVNPEVFCGYAPIVAHTLSYQQKRAVAQLAGGFPYKNEALNREAARLFALLGVDAISPGGLLSQCTADSRLEDDIHYLIVLARLPVSHSDSETVRRMSRALVMLHHKLAARHDIASRNWPLRIGELFEALCVKHPRLADAVIEDEQFGLPAHALFVIKMDGAARIRGARTLLAAVTNSGVDWDTDLIEALTVLPPEELRPHLHERFHEPALRDAIALVLAKSPAADSRPLLIEALGSVQPNVVDAVARGLAKLDGAARQAELTAALAALRRQTLAPNEKQTRQALVALLERWTDTSFEIRDAKGVDLAVAYQPWFDWFAKKYPDEAKSLTRFAGDQLSWQKRLSAIDWSAGDTTAGKAVFERLSCHRCHSVAGRLGPDLAGAAARFSRADLFASIIDPSREVAPLYQTTEVVTDDGHVYNGLIVYESPDTTMLQTGPDTVIRVSGVRKDAMRKSGVSLMPVGLLNDASDRDLADLYAYLQRLSH